MNKKVELLLLVTLSVAVLTLPVMAATAPTSTPTPTATESNVTETPTSTVTENITDTPTETTPIINETPTVTPTITENVTETPTETTPIITETPTSTITENVTETPTVTPTPTIAENGIVTITGADIGKTAIVSGLPIGAEVQFVLNNGVPVPIISVDGTAKYLAEVAGNLTINASANGSSIAPTNFSVTLENLVGTIVITDADIGKTAVVNGLPTEADVQFVLNGGVPVPVIALDGTAKYLVQVTGRLLVKASINGDAIDPNNYTVTLQNLSTTPSPTPSQTAPIVGGGGGGSTTGNPHGNGTFWMTPTVTVTEQPTITETVQTTQPSETTTTAEVTQTTPIQTVAPTATKPAPGFELVVTIAAMIFVAIYVLARRR
jgi:hypothetical protein